MTLPLLLAALLLAGLGGWLGRRRRVLGQAMMVLGGLGLIGSVAWQIRQNVFSPQPRMPNRCEMAVSSCLATCMMEDTAGQGGSVVLLFPQRRLMDAETERSYEEGFTPPLRHGHVRLHVKAVRLEPGDRDAGHGLAALKRALAQTPEALAVVSYAGVQTGFESLFADSQPRIPPFYVFDPDGTTNWLAALKAGHIRAVVLPRPGVNPRDRETAAGMPEALFERYYLLATPANADQVASSLQGHLQQVNNLHP
jgi:hypothetical protein